MRVMGYFARSNDSLRRWPAVKLRAMPISRISSISSALGPSSWMKDICPGSVLRAGGSGDGASGADRGDFAVLQYNNTVFDGAVANGKHFAAANDDWAGGAGGS